MHCVCVFVDYIMTPNTYDTHKHDKILSGYIRINNTQAHPQIKF